MNIKNVTVAGGGVLGSQIAYQAAFCGFNVTIWLRSDASIERAKPKLERLRSLYLADLDACKANLDNPAHRFPAGLIPDRKDITAGQIDDLKTKADAVPDHMTLTTDLREAFSDADLVIESMAEDLEAKKAFYQQVALLLPEKTIVVTNSSTLLPSSMAPFTGRPEKFLALHFANNIWRQNMAEIMGHDGTGQTYYDQIAAFAGAIHMIPLRLHKEQAGYILNSMLVPFLNAAQALNAKGVADPQTFDLTWRLGTGAPLGPFQILDIVGLTTAYNIVVMNPEAQNPDSIPGKIASILKAYIDAGKTGITAGEGFYKYR